MATNKTNAPKVPKQIALDPVLWHQVKVQAATEGIHANRFLDRALRRELERVEKERSEQKQVA